MANLPAKIDTRPIANKIRDLINWIAVMNKEELREGEGKKIEDDTAKGLKMKLQEIASMLGQLAYFLFYCFLEILLNKIPRN